MSFLNSQNLKSENLLYKQSGNFLNNLEIHSVGFQDGHCIWLQVLGKVGSPFQFVPNVSLEGQNAYGCYDANKETKVEKFFIFFITKLGLLQIYPPYRNLVPRF